MPSGRLLDAFWTLGRPWGSFLWFFNLVWFLERFGHAKVIQFGDKFCDFDDILAVVFLPFARAFF